PSDRQGNWASCARNGGLSIVSVVDEMTSPSGVTTREITTVWGVPSGAWATRSSSWISSVGSSARAGVTSRTVVARGRAAAAANRRRRRKGVLLQRAGAGAGRRQTEERREGTGMTDISPEITVRAKVSTPGTPMAPGAAMRARHLCHGRGPPGAGSVEGGPGDGRGLAPGQEGQEGDAEGGGGQVGDGHVGEGVEVVEVGAGQGQVGGGQAQHHPEQGQ